MNKFVANKIHKALKNIKSKQYRNYIIKEGYLLNKLGIADEKSLIKFHYVMQFIPFLVKKVCRNHNKNITIKASAYICKNLDKISTHDDIKDIFCNYIATSSIIKIAYPNKVSDVTPIKNYDMTKWKTALNDILIRTRIYGNKTEAIEYITKGWTDMDEIKDFTRWVNREQNLNKLYKSALVTENASVPIHMPYIPGLSPRIPSDISSASMDAKELKELHVNKIKQQILSRINSIKKIISMQNSREFVGGDFNKIIDTLLGLERDILKIRTASMFDDVIYRAKNYLEKEGCDDSVVTMIVKIAQLVPMDSELDLPAEPGIEDVPGSEQEGAEVSGDPKQGAEAISQFVRNMKGYDSKSETPEAITEKFDKIKQKYEAKIGKKSSDQYGWFNIHTPELLWFEKVAEGIGNMMSTVNSNLIALGQLGEEGPEITTKPRAKPMREEIPITEPEPEPEPEPELTEKVDIKEEIPLSKDVALESKKPIPKDSIDDAFDDITISDVVSRLEALSRVFKNREIARQLSIIDLMLDKLGLSGFFPSLAEATRSALESNQYCQTRIDEVLSKLISAVDENGNTIINTNLLEPKKKEKAPDNIIDKEMQGYLGNTPTEVSAKPVSVTEEVISELPKEKPKPSVAPAMPTQEAV